MFTSKKLDELCPHTFDDAWLWWNNANFAWDSIPNMNIETDYVPTTTQSTTTTESGQYFILCSFNINVLLK